MGRARITTVIATSPTPTIPEIGHIRRTVESLDFVPELAASPILIVFDAPNGNGANPDYEQYKRNVKTYYEDRANVKMLHLAAWGCLSGVMERAAALVARFMFVQQHDLPLVRRFDCDKVLNVRNVPAVNMSGSTSAKLFHGLGSNPLLTYQTPYLELTRTGCYRTKATWRHHLLSRS
jgi:hypothetical protein